MKRILATGASGQVGPELVLALRDSYGADNVIAAGHTRALPAEIMETGPHTRVDVTDYEEIERAFKAFEIDTLYHLVPCFQRWPSRNRVWPTKST